MTNRSRVSSLWLVLLALGGLLAGHVVSYFVVAPDSHERGRLLELTGHSQHSAFGTVALAATFAALIAIAFQIVRRSRGVGYRPVVGRVRVGTILWFVQTAGFVALETWERGHGPSGIAELLNEPAFLIGLVAQLLVAIVATVLVLLVHATVGALLRGFVSPAEAPQGPLFSSQPLDRPRESIARAAWNLRGPPSPAGSPS